MIKLLTVFLVFLLAITQYRLWWGENGLVELRQLQTQVSNQEEENRALSKRNQLLNAEVAELKGKLEAVEERARFDLGMIGEGETFIWLVGEPPRVFELPENLEETP
ncbi:cell division protein FtsB [Marinospirillum celere]|uniref:Cell division protein FtsB n=1 Tax=Marinospirillum celere TaxID=1122252 RepID=A0A1I1IV57_9GAMM|nr:cell division protein FtsB [Marinospirillum celere]SFC37110.1 cell division protein FtsB [Marinospirillum celere]